MIIKNYLEEDEFANYVKYLKDNDITIYFGDYLGLNKSTVRTLDNALNSDDLDMFEKYEVKKIQEELNKYNNKVYKK